VYHFRNEEFGLKSLKERRLKISRIMELNDPFEFFAAELSDKQLRQTLQESKAEFSKTNGILCFSKNWKNPVQWSHYADHHKGICMGFEIPNVLLSKVKYVKNRINYSGEIDFNLMKRLLTTKFEHWCYEQEFRSFVDLDSSTKEKGLFFHEFSEQLQLKRVIVGSQSTISRSRIQSVLGNIAKGIEVFKARPAFKSFSVVRNKNESLWT